MQGSPSQKSLPKMNYASALFTTVDGITTSSVWTVWTFIYQSLCLISFLTKFEILRSSQRPPYWVQDICIHLKTNSNIRTHFLYPFRFQEFCCNTTLLVITVPFGSFRKDWRSRYLFRNFCSSCFHMLWAFLSNASGSTPSTDVSPSVYQQAL